MAGEDRVTPHGTVRHITSKSMSDFLTNYLNVTNVTCRAHHTSGLGGDLPTLPQQGFQQLRHVHGSFHPVLRLSEVQAYFDANVIAHQPSKRILISHVVAGKQDGCGAGCLPEELHSLALGRVD